MDKNEGKYQVFVFIMEGKVKRIQTIFRRLDYNFSHLDMNGNEVGFMEGAEGSPIVSPKQGKNSKNRKYRRKKEMLEPLVFPNELKRERKKGLMVYENEHQQGAEGLPFRSTTVCCGALTLQSSMMLVVKS